MHPPLDRLDAYANTSIRISKLEKELGLSPSHPIWNVTEAISYIHELESRLAARDAAATPAAAATIEATTDSSSLPPRKRLRYTTYRESSARITELERQLGLSAGRKIFEMREANTRIGELESMAALMSGKSPINTISAVNQQPAPAAAKAPLSGRDANQPQSSQPSEQPGAVSPTKPNADEQIKSSFAAGGTFTQRRLEKQRKALAGVDVTKLSGIERECAERILNLKKA